MDWNRTKNDRYWNRNFKRIWNRQALIPEFLIKTIKGPVSGIEPGRQVMKAIMRNQ